VAQTGVEPTNSLPTGTDYVSSAINSPFDNKIDDKTSEDIANTNQTEATNETKASNGTGTSFTVHYNTTDTRDEDVSTDNGRAFRAVQNVDGTTGRKPYIGLGHELVHGKHINQGKVNTKKSNAIDGDSGKRGSITEEENDTRKEENKIRKEQGTPDRKVSN